MRRVVVGMFVAGCSIGLAAGAASVASSDTAARPPAVKRLTLLSKTVKFTVVDTGPVGPSPGDLVLKDDTLLRNGREVGQDRFTCVAHEGDVVNGIADCTGTLMLRGGQLHTQAGASAEGGRLSGAGAITGGTGRYSGARGELKFESTTGTDVEIRITLIRDPRS